MFKPLHTNNLKTTYIPKIHKIKK